MWFLAGRQIWALRNGAIPFLRTKNSKRPIMEAEAKEKPENSAPHKKQKQSIEIIKLCFN
jgi:hypothetical protein